MMKEYLMNKFIFLVDSNNGNHDYVKRQRKPLNSCDSVYYLYHETIKRRERKNDDIDANVT